MEREGKPLSEEMRRRYSKTARILEHDIERTKIILASRKDTQHDVVGYDGQVEGAEKELKRLLKIQNEFLNGDVRGVAIYLGEGSEVLRVALSLGEHPMDDRQEFLDARKELGFVE